ncbi:MAG: hypothetical protein IKF11_02415 [Methanobrevibacter sp.]|nr:hypothetical protein [Methanobrevibacter sp.]
MINIDVEIKDSFHKKLNHSKLEKAVELGLDHAIQECENTCRIEAPIDTGNLRRSIKKHNAGKGVRELRATDAPYWVYVQFGTSKMKENPFVTRTVTKVGPKIPKYIKQEVDHAIGG